MNEYKTRNILSLADRVEVIREYESNLTQSSLKTLARKFYCSSKQIQNILRNREEILKSYEAIDGGQKSKDVLEKRQQKIAFLGKVVYEYIQRALYFNYSIDDEKVRQKALQIKEFIALANFQPTYDWLNDFKKTYGITAFDLQSLRKCVVITEAKNPQMGASDMIQYINRMEQNEATNYNHKNLNYSKEDINDNSNQHLDESNNLNNCLEPKIIYKIEDEEEDEELQKLNFNDTPNKPSGNNHNSPNTTPSIKSTLKRRASSPLPDIESVDEALKHVKVLEEFAMLNDNFRAIGLLTQLEQIFKNQLKK